MVKNSPANGGDARGTSSIPGFEGFPAVGNDNLSPYCFLENPVDRRAWWATFHGAAQTDHAHTHIH